MILAHGVGDAGDAGKYPIYILSIILINTVPAWFGPAVNQAINEALQPVLNVALTPIRQFMYKSFNMRCFDGVDSPYMVLPFNDGTPPNAAAVRFTL